MFETAIDEDRLKTLFKTAMIEVIEEKKDFLQELFEDVIEEVALVRAIEEGRQTKTVSRDEVFKLFEDKT